MVIHKYPLQVGTKVSIELPDSARVVACGMQSGQPHIWVEKRDAACVRIRTFEVFGTGWDIPSRSTYVGTVFQSHLVWHIYEAE